MHGRVGDPLEVAACSGIGEDDRPQGGSVEGAVGLQDVGPEAGDDGLESGGSGLDHLAGEGVGVDVRRAPFGESTGHD